MWDLAESPVSIALLESFYKSGKPIALVCHAPGVLRHVNFQGEPLVNGKHVTGFTNGEEAEVQLTQVVPFLVEDELMLAGRFASSRSHLEEVLNTLKSRPARMVVYSAYQDAKPDEWLSEHAHIPAVKIPFTVGGTEICSRVEPSAARLAGVDPRSDRRTAMPSLGSCRFPAGRPPGRSAGPWPGPPRTAGGRAAGRA